ncbi:MAG TPA: cysteine desulfurase-like protein [Kofleriaceae bacterium]|nr:cysteine desulfurase-like protein [Kofleriaceae bacterium]
MPDPALDLDRIRAAFPALASGFTFLDNAGGSQTLALVADRVREYLCSTSVQLGASYAVSELAGERVHGAVAATAAYLGGREHDEAVFGSSTTQLLANLALAIEPTLSPGDEIVISEADHHANVGPWQRLAARRGLVVRRWPLDRQTWRLECAGLEPLLSPRTRLVAFAHVSNVLGSIHDVAAITQLVHAHGARVCVDGVAYAPHRAIDVTAWDVDFYVFSFYKVYGPHAAVLFGKRALLDGLAGINHEFITSIPYKLQPGNLNFELAYGTLGIHDYLATLGGPRAAFDAIAAHEEQLADRLLAYLRSRAHVRIYGDSSADRARRVPTISFTVDGRTPESIVREVDRHAVGIRHGDFYSKGVVAALGLADRGGVVRVSAVHYNTVAEIDRTIEALAAAGV